MIINSTSRSAAGIGKEWILIQQYRDLCKRQVDFQFEGVGISQATNWRHKLVDVLPPLCPHTIQTAHFIPKISIGPCYIYHDPLRSNPSHLSVTSGCPLR